MNGSAIAKSYAQSLAWVALLLAVGVSLAAVVELVFVDFVHGNPHRTHGNAIFMMVVQAPLFGVLALIGTLLIFTLPQLFQATLASGSDRLFGSGARFMVLPALPLTAVLTWYCYDYLTPSDINLGIYTEPDWVPFQHGITLVRYAWALAFQTPVTLFSFLYSEARVHGRSNKPTLIAALTLIIIACGITGYARALNQFQFL